jgi:2-polyprenyl-3-methyl-5-hydroxy-6-metoxy-1,4-benzoquinol methylase
VSVSTSCCHLCDAPLFDDLPPRWIKDGLELVACPVCSLVCRRQLPRAEDLEAIYDRSYFGGSGGPREPENYLDYLADAEAHRLAARRRLRFVNRWKGHGALLDVGAAAGFFVDEAMRAGWDAEGVDVAPSMTEWGRRRLGASLQTGTFASMDPGGRAFDAVTMWDYIEHSVDPRGDVGKALALLRPGGVLMLSTGDIGSLLARLSGSRWHLLTPKHHNFYFSQRTIRSMLYREGFHVEQIAHPASPYSVRYCLHKLQTMVASASLRRAASRVAELPVGRLVVPVNLCDVMVVAARKIR